MNKFYLWITAAAIAAGMSFPVTAMAEADDIIIEAETLSADMMNITNDISISSQALSTAGGGAYEIIKTMPNTAFPDDKIIAAYSFEIAAEGTYQLGIALQDITKDFSACSVSVDDSDYTAINQGIIESDSGSIGDYMVSYITSLKYNLSEGEHTLFFRLDSARSDGRGFAHVDRFTFKEAEPEATDTIHIRGQQAHTKNFPIDGVGAEYYGTVFAKNTLEVQTSSQDAFPVEGLIVTYSFDVTEEGDYQLTVSASQHSGSGLQYLSPYGIAVNDGEVTEINTQTAGSASSPNGGFNTECQDVSDSSRFPIAIYDTNLYYHLMPGANTVSFKVLSSREMDTKAFAALAYIEFNKQPEPEVQPAYIINGTDGHSLEYSSGAEGVSEDTTSLPGTLNVKTLADVLFPDGGITLNYSFRSETAGSYKLSLSASVHTRTTTLSTYAVSVNGSDYVTIDSSSAGAAESPNGGWSTTITGVDSLIGVYKTNLIYDIEQGMNTVSIKILTPRDADGRAYFYLEYIRLQLVDSFADAEFAEDEKYIEIGSNAVSGIRAIGETGTEMDISEATLSFSSDNPKAADVDKNGVITANGMGSAIIMAEVTIDGITRTAMLPVYITVNGKYAAPVVFSSGGTDITSLPSTGSVTAETAIVNTNSSSERVTLIVTAFDQGGMLSCKVSGFTIDAGDTETLSVDIPCAGAERIEAFVLESVPDQLTISRSTELRAE